MILFIALSKVTPILPIADLEALKIIELYPLEDIMEIEIDEIVKTEQWKKAKKMNCDFLVMNLKVEDICHFSRYRVRSNTISARDLDFLKKAITSSSKFKYSSLAVNIFNENEEIFNLWGPAYLSGSSSLWYFRIKDSEENILAIDIQQVYNQIYFDVIETRNVPNRAIVHDYNEN